MTRAGRVPELDVLRFGAAAGVLVFHFYVLLPGDTGLQRAIAVLAQFGFLGVPLFFMISGFVILWTACNKAPRDFLLARLCRLYPSYWVCVLITSTVLMLAGNAPSRMKVAANLTMLQHLLGFDAIDQVYWTLFIELKFYGLVLALLLCRQLPHIERWLTLWLGLSALSLIGSAWHDGPIPGLDTLVFEGYAACFASGCYAYLIRTEGSTLRRWVGFAAGALLSLLAALKLQHHYTHASDWKTLSAVSGIMLLVAGAFIVIALRLWTLPVSRTWYWLGSLTYPLYLLHAMAGTTVYRMLPAGWGVWTRMLIALTPVLAVTILLAVTIEQHGCSALYRLLSRLGHRRSTTAIASSLAGSPAAPSVRTDTA